MKRVADLRNRIFRKWASQNRIDFIDVAGSMPNDPALFIDAMHNSILGVKIRAWIVLQDLWPLIEADLDKGKLPRPDRIKSDKHPYIPAPELEKLSDIANSPN